MTGDPLLIAVLACALAAAILSLIVLLRPARGVLSPEALAQLAALAAASERTDKTIRDEISRMRNEAEDRGQKLRDTLTGQIAPMGEAIGVRVETTRVTVDEGLKAFTTDSRLASSELRVEIGKTVSAFGDAIRTRVSDLAGGVTERMTQFSDHQEKSAAEFRRTLAERVDALSAALSGKIDDFTVAQTRGQADLQTHTAEALGRVQAQVGVLAAENNKQQLELREAVQKRLDELRAGNDAKLEEMRKAVDEQLQTALEKRLTESFSLVSERLDNVQRGLGEMQTLAVGVGDLKRVLTNVKTRGTWAEVQLSNVLNSILAPELFESNVEIKAGSGERVEFTVLLPTGGERLHLPIDAKFPVEDYERLCKAQDDNNPADVDTATKGLEAAIKREAQRISGKYIAEGITTDYAILYLPSEGLYAEVVRRPALMSEILSRHRIVVAGPSTFAAILNSIQMGHKALAIHHHSGEIRRILGEAKAEFLKYEGLWETVADRLNKVQTAVENVRKKTGTINRKLKGIETLEGPNAPALLELSVLDDADTE